jgi:hypothetical protein
MFADEYRTDIVAARQRRLRRTTAAIVVINATLCRIVSARRQLARQIRRRYLFAARRILPAPQL